MAVRAVPSRDRADLDFSSREEVLFHEQLQSLRRGVDRSFAILMVLQWVAGMAAACWLTPLTWAGAESQVHLHAWASLFLGCLISVMPVCLTVLRPGDALTRHVVALAQMAWSALFIHISGGRIETHFHVFGSLAFLAFYRDWWVIVTASTVIVVDHLIRGLAWPESAFGVSSLSIWRPLEHGGWLVFEDVFLCYSIWQSRREMRAISVRQARIEEAHRRTEEQVLTRTAELRHATAKLRAMNDSLPLGMFASDQNGSCVQTNRTCEGITGQKLDFARGDGWIQALHPDDRERVVREWYAAVRECRDFRSVHRFLHADGGVVWTNVTAAPLREEQRVTGFVGLIEDVTQRRQLETQLRHAQKLEAIGQLAAGIAHEINTPIQYISDNNRFLRECFAELGKLLQEYDRVLLAASSRALTDELLDHAADARRLADLEFLTAEIPQAIEQSLEGLNRVATIVQAMKEFAQPGANEKTPTDLNRSIESTLVVARNEWKHVAEVKTDLDGQLPLVPSHANDLNQVILSLVVNAAHAINAAQERGGAKPGTISVRTKRLGDWVEMRISDTGTGIPEEIQSRIFEPFFTTKGVGHGTGQGLAQAYSVIVEKHGGSISFETEVGQGTTFIVRLPLETPQEGAVDAPAVTAGDRVP
ncbi:MAG TPA: ATP-binding protein [Pirellulales bacterium]|nr:ATP-binding protein [Pirellulales bacterium]